MSRQCSHRVALTSCFKDSSAPLVAGKVFPLTLVFESGASVALEVEILPIDVMVGSEKTERLTIRHADDD